LQEASLYLPMNIKVSFQKWFVANRRQP